MVRWIHVVSRIALTLVAALLVAAATPLTAQQVAAPVSTPATAQSSTSPSSTAGPRLRPELRRTEANFNDAGASAPMPSDSHTFTITTLVLVLAVVILVLLIVH